MLVTTVCASLVPFLVPADTDSWPGWRGPGGNGVAPGAPPVEWSEEKNVRWKTAIPGEGTSSPIVWGEYVFVTAAIPVGKPERKEEDAEREESQGRPGGDPGDRRHGGFDGMSVPPVEHEFVVLALSRKNGEILWKAAPKKLTPHQGKHGDGSFAAPTPVTDGVLVIASFGSIGIFAYDYAGEFIWQKDLGDMNISMSFGEGASPVLHGDLLIHPWDHDGDSFLVALDKRTGEEKWRVARDSSTTWCTPLVVCGANGPEVVMAGVRTLAYDLATGKQTWAFGEAASAGSGGGGGEHGRAGGESGQGGGGHPSFGGRQGGRGGGSSVISSPVVYDGVLLMSTGSRGGSLCAILPITAKDEIPADGEALLWSHEGDTPNIPSPIAYEGVLYALKSNSGILSTFDVATGERLYGPERLRGVADAYASPIIAGGKLYFSGRDGTFEVVKVEGGIETLAINTLEDEFDDTLAVVGNELFLRGKKHLYCIAAD